MKGSAALSHEYFRSEVAISLKSFRLSPGSELEGSRGEFDASKVYELRTLTNQDKDLTLISSIFLGETRITIASPRGSRSPPSSLNIEREEKFGAQGAPYSPP